MNNLQRELRDAMTKRDSARTRLNQVLGIHGEALRRSQEASSKLEQARVLVRDVAGRRALGFSDDKALAAARAAVRKSIEEHEVALAEVEGVFDRISPLEMELAEHDAHVTGVAVRIASSQAVNIEHESLDLAQRLGDLIAHRRALAVFAMRDGSDPLGALDPSSEFRRELLRRLGEPVPGEHPRERIVDVVTLADLMDPAEEAAAE